MSAKEKSFQDTPAALAAFDHFKLDALDASQEKQNGNQTR